MLQDNGNDSVCDENEMGHRHANAYTYLYVYQMYFTDVCNLPSKNLLRTMYITLVKLNYFFPFFFSIVCTLFLLLISKFAENFHFDTKMKRILFD